MKTRTPATLLLMVFLALSTFAINSIAGENQTKGNGKSGIIGQSVMNYGSLCWTFSDPPTPCEGAVPYKTTILIYSQAQPITIGIPSTEHLVATATTDEEGYFRVSLKPGTYYVTASPPPPSPITVGGVVTSATTMVIVPKKEFVPAFVFSMYQIL